MVKERYFSGSNLTTLTIAFKRRHLIKSLSFKPILLNL